MQQRTELRIPEHCAGQRLDVVLTVLLPELSRGRIQSLLEQQHILVDELPARRALKVRGGEQITAVLTPTERTAWQPQDIPLDVLFEDDDVLVVNKPAGLVVHPGAGNPDGTLVNALLAAYPAQVHLPRAGIVHRLDKDTTGVMVVARSDLAHQTLVAALAARSVSREYLALVRGTPTGGGTVDAPLGRHPRDRKRMHVVSGGRAAITHYRIEQRFDGHTLLRVRLETGRTHQIRVHMSHLGLPLVGDPVYGGRPRPVAGLPAALAAALASFGRQALHAHTLEFEHPRSGAALSFSAPLPADMRSLLNTLESCVR